LYLAANHGTNGTQLWKSAGTSSGTLMVKAINPSGSSNPANLFNENGNLFLSANDGTHGNQLWVVAPTARFDVSATGSTTAGVSVDVTVTARDTLGNVDIWYTGTVHFTSTDTQAVLPANYTFTSTDAGAHTFSSGATLKTAGSQTITATDTTTSSVTRNPPVTLTPAAP